MTGRRKATLFQTRWFRSIRSPSTRPFACPGRLAIDGRLDETAWVDAVKTTPFVELISGDATEHETRGALLWDDENLYVGFWVAEPNVEARFRRRDAPIYRENDVELFIAGKDAYYEFEINALGTIYEAFFVWRDAYEQGGYEEDPQLARGVRRSQPFNGVGFTKHPRGGRIAFLGYDLPKLRTAVHVNGTLNDDSDTDEGWTVEMALPWESMKWLAHGDGRALPPEAGRPVEDQPVPLQQTPRPLPQRRLGRLGIRSARRVGLAHPRGVPDGDVREGMKRAR